MRLVFMGTPEFAVPSLNALCAENMIPELVLTQPQRRRKRRGQAESSPVAIVAKTMEIPFMETEDVGSGEAFEKLQEIQPDAIIVVAFGQLLKQHVLDLPKYGCLNLHPSLLPKYRGAAPIQWAILNGDYDSGISIIRLVRKMDAGPVLSQQPFRILNSETAGSALARSAQEGAAQMVELLQRLEAGEEVEEVLQDEDEVTFAGLLNREHGFIRMDQPSQRVWDQIRGVLPWPKAEVRHVDAAGEVSRVLIHDAEPTQHIHSESSGTVIAVSPEFIEVACEQGTLLVTELQVENKPIRRATTFLKSHPIAVGDRFETPESTSA